MMVVLVGWFGGVSVVVVMVEFQWLGYVSVVSGCW